MAKTEKRVRVLLNILVALCLLFALAPLYIVFTNSLKNLGEMGQSVFSLPPAWRFSNYKIAIEKMYFFTSMSNTIKIELIANIGLLLFAPMTAYWLIRKPNKLNNILYFTWLGSMAIPFQAVMIPFVKFMNTLGLQGNIPGLSIAYWGMGCSGVIFLTYGAIKSIPYEVEEAAIIDGCSQLGVYFRIVFPLLRTIVLTYTILNIFWVWNDYLMPMVLLGNDKSLYTIQMALRIFSGEFQVRWDYLLPAVVLAMIVPVTLFIIFQKMIVEGMVSGAVKG